MVWTGRASIGLALGLMLALPQGARAKAARAPEAPTTQPGSSPAARRLTVDDAVALGLRNSKPLLVAAQSVRRARAVVNQNRAGLLPNLNASLLWTHLDQGSTITFPGPKGLPQTIPIVLQDQKSIGVDATLPVDILGQIRAAVQAAQFQEIAARLDYNRIRNETVSGIKTDYNDVLRAKAFVSVADQSLRNARDRETTAAANRAAGTGTRFEVLRAQTDVANAQEGLIAAGNRVNLAIATLNNALSLDQNTPLETAEPSQPPASHGDFNAAVAEAYRTRPEVLQADAQIRAAQKGVVLAKRSLRPTLGLSWSLNYAPDVGGFAPRTTTWAAVARVSVPLYDGGLARARTRTARADVESARLARQETLDAVALEVRQAHLALVDASDRLTVANTALTEAQEQYRLAQIRFKAGVTLTTGGSPLLEISDAQTALTQAQNNQVNARYDVLDAQARLDRAIGRYAYGRPPQPGLPAPAATGASK